MSNPKEEGPIVVATSIHNSGEVRIHVQSTTDGKKQTNTYRNVNEKGISNDVSTSNKGKY